ncbi:MAG: PfkB family carbohydrate kinase [Gemmatimonadota bacterium]|jgi:rfaE bifunctional protein kinase chain/domain|nr:carbohydrate kinase [Gemmatimonadota bacterium]MDP6461188.1 PfkB family carbohydrate kinase [Gemmatimonadota bacterium]MDP6528924.1 PfkB family carbohydrate kinase [Gemmatimonadota bacterium]MDP6803223.1 PfkB family carbohydrate kinase [Gemmatimonadota bacterium]MDP7032688.1 PfkB family carbohydrate kinase [Gemmatimonadota bacterium]
MTLDGHRARLAELLRRMKGIRVLVLGDLVADEYVYGETRRVSREAPVLILQRVGGKVIPGGAGNAVLNVAALGGVPVPVGIVGPGATADRLVAEFERRGIETASIVRDSVRPTVRKTRVMAGGAHGQKQQVLRIDEADEAPVSSEAEEALLARGVEWARQADAVILSDYGYGTLTDRVIEEVLAVANARGLPVCADSRYRLRAFRGVTFATPNEEEAAQAVGGDPGQDHGQVADRLRERLNASFALVTRGRDGMIVSEGSSAPVEIPAWGEAEAADVTGAGDTVAATTTLAIAAGASPADAARLASITAGIVVTKHGAATTTPGEVARLAGL